MRQKEKGVEILLTSYEQFQNPHLMERMSFARVLGGLSQHRYEEAALTIPETFGIKQSSISRKFIKATARQLKKLLERDLSHEEIVAIFLDGKWLTDHNLIIAVGGKLDGSKIILGFIEGASENSSICKDFLKDLIKRGLKTDQKILFIVDGSKGFHKAIKELFGEKGFIQRCQWHKRENVLKYLPLKNLDHFRSKLPGAESSSYEEAKKRLNQIKSELKVINESAVRSLEEGLEETLTLQRLGVFKELGPSLKTTNIAESINSRVEADTKGVCYWKNSNQRQRWVGSILLEVEPKLRKLKGCRHLPTQLKKMTRRLKLFFVNKGCRDGEALS